MFLRKCLKSISPPLIPKYNLLQYRYQQLLEDLAGRGYRVVAEDYRSGWRHSVVRTEIAPPAVGDKPPRLRVAVRLRHGPAVWLERWPPTLATARGRVTVVDAPRALPPLLLNARLAATGALDARLRVPDVAYSGAAGQLHFAASEAHLQVPGDGHWRLRGGSRRLEATDASGRSLRLGDLGWDLAAGDAGAVLPLSRLHLSLGSMRLDASSARPPVALAGLDIEATAAVANGEAGVDAVVAVDALAIDAQAYAPSALTASITGIDAAALLDLRERFLALDGGALTASQQGVVMGRLVMAKVPELLSRTPTVQVQRLAVTTPYGSLDATAELGLVPPDAARTHGAAAPAMAGAGAHLLPTLLGRLMGDARVSAPQALVLALVAEQQTRRARRELALRGEPADELPPALAADVETAAQAATAALVREGWLEAQQGRLVAALRLDRGTLRVNGKAVSLPGAVAPAGGP